MGYGLSDCLSLFCRDEWQQWWIPVGVPLVCPHHHQYISRSAKNRERERDRERKRFKKPECLEGILVLSFERLSIAVGLFSLSFSLIFFPENPPSLVLQTDSPGVSLSREDRRRRGASHHKPCRQKQDVEYETQSVVSRMCSERALHLLSFFPFSSLPTTDCRLIIIRPLSVLSVFYSRLKERQG